MIIWRGSPCTKRVSEYRRFFPCEQAADFARTKMKVKMLDKPVEKFTIDVHPVDSSRGTLSLIWERTAASVSFKLLP